MICEIRAADRAPHEPGGWAPSPGFANVDTCPFLLDREHGGPVIVSGDFAELVDVAIENTGDPSPHWGRYCSDRGITARSAREAVVQPGDWIKSVGVVERRPVEPGAAAGFRDGGIATYVIGDFDHPLLVTPGHPARQKQ